jgi:uncharacterized membrane protein YccC
VIRVAGETYASPDDVRAAAAALERDAERTTGEETPARRSAMRHVEALRAAARQAEEAAAAKTPQPSDRPGSPRGKGRRRGPPRRRPTLTPGLSRAYQRTGIPATLTSTTTLLLQALGMTIGIAALVILVGNRRGPQAFSELAGTLAGAVAWIVEPTDPLAPRPRTGPAASVGGLFAASSRARGAPLTYGYGRGG